MAGRKIILTPGPTPLPHTVRKAMGSQIVPHRSAEFSVAISRLRTLLKRIFKTKREISLLCTSGTGGMEAVLTNFFRPGDKVVVVDGGKFGHRWAEMAAKFGLQVVSVPVEWGRPVNADILLNVVKDTGGVKGVFVQSVETSTGVRHPVEVVAKKLGGRGPLLIVDAIASVGCEKVYPEEWGVDVLISATQKGLMCPPGLSMVWFSERAEKTAARLGTPRYYLDVLAESEALKKNTTLFTPPVQLFFALTAALEILFDKGIENVFAETAMKADAVRTALKRAGMDIVPKENPAVSLTAFYWPESIDGDAAVEKLEEMGVYLGRGQGPLKGRAARISHMGAVKNEELRRGISTLCRYLRSEGINIDLSEVMDAFNRVIGADL